MLGPKERFSSRVDDYVRYRPFYPEAVVEVLRAECGLKPTGAVADIGAGPGNLARLFLANGNPVVGVEPNREMREAGQKLLADEKRYSALDGSAESTTLAPQSIDLITAGQAFHWFDRAPTRVEFQRILKPQGWVALIWNMRRLDDSAFAQGYEDVLRSIPEYEIIKADAAPVEIIREFFSPGIVREATLAHEQLLDRASFYGRVLSSSYVPQAGTPGHEEVINALDKLFDRESRSGKVRFAYDTQVYFGHLD